VAFQLLRWWKSLPTDSIAASPTSATALAPFMLLLPTAAVAFTAVSAVALPATETGTNRRKASEPSVNQPAHILCTQHVPSVWHDCHRNPRRLTKSHHRIRHALPVLLPDVNLRV
jgi:hypothetical protein